MPEFGFGFIAYFVVIALFAFYAYRRTQTGLDFDLGGRKLTAPVSALSAGASDMSGWLLLGLPGAIYLSGISAGWIAVGLVIGAFLNWQFVAPRLRLLCTAFKSEVHTLPQLFSFRTGENRVFITLTASIVVIVFFTVYISAGFVAAAKLFESVLGWSFQTGVLVGAVITMLYTAVGGFFAVSWSDAFQALLMLAALLIVPMLALAVIDVSLINLTAESVGVFAIISSLAWGLGYFGQPHILARFMAIQEPSQIGRAKVISMSWMVLTTFGAIAVALTGIVLIPGLEDSETVFIELSRVLLNPWVAGILIAAILAAVMSTVDSQLLVVSTSIVNDLLKIQKRRLLVSRAVLVSIAVLATLLALGENNVILDIVAYAWAGLGASFGPCVLFCCYWKKTTAIGLTAGMLVGATVTILWHELGPAFPNSIGLVYEIIPAFLAACLAIVGVSLVTHPDKYESADVLSTLKDS